MRILPLLTVCALAAPAVALAQQSNAPEASRTEEGFEAQYRLRGVAVGNYPLDAAGDQLGQNGYAEHRLRVGALFKSDPISFHLELDAANGLVVGETTQQFPYLPYRRDSYAGWEEPSSVFVRQLWAEVKLPVAVVRLGHMLSDWGLGVVTNDGTGTPDWGDHYYGDEVERALVATRPLSRVNPALAPLVAALGGDIVYQDRTAQLTQGDAAFQGVVVLDWAPEDSADRLGLYAVRRGETDRDGNYLHVWLFDAHGRWEKTFASGQSLHLEGELARAFGDTDAVRDTYHPSYVIDQMGAAGELGYGRDLGSGRLEGVLQAGYASGDDAPESGRLTAFTFNPEYRVGMILFDEVLAFQTAQSASELSSPALLGRPPAGARFLPTQGGVTNAIYAMPTVRYSPGGPLSFRAGLLLALADKALTDPYQTDVQSGGVRHTYLGSTTDSRDLGQEIDLGARWTRHAHGHTLAVDLQGGELFPGAAFTYPDGSRMAPVARVLAGLTYSM